METKKEKREKETTEIRFISLTKKRKGIEGSISAG